MMFIMFLDFLIDFCIEVIVLILYWAALYTEVFLISWPLICVNKKHKNWKHLLI